MALLVLGLAGAAAAALNEPVTVSATAPESVEAGKPFQLEVAVEAEAGALEITAAPLRLGVKLAPDAADPCSAHRVRRPCRRRSRRRPPALLRADLSGARDRRATRRGVVSPFSTTPRNGSSPPTPTPK